MSVREYAADDFDQVRAMLLAEGWGDRAADERRLRSIIASATRVVVSEVEGVVVGFGRCLTDNTSNGYLSMVIVDPSHRRRGIGSAIVGELMGDDDRLTWMLRAGHPGSDPFWEGIGFSQSTIAYERPRKS